MLVAWHYLSPDHLPLSRQQFNTLLLVASPPATIDPLYFSQGDFFLSKVILKQIKPFPCLKLIVVILCTWNKIQCLSLSVSISYLTTSSSFTDGQLLNHWVETHFFATLVPLHLCCFSA